MKNFVFFLLLVTAKIAAQSAHDYRVEGDQFFSKKEMDKAEEAYRRSLEREPQHAAGLYNLGNALYFQGRYPQAAESFEKSAARSKTAAERADAFHNLGNSNFKSGKYREAAEAFKNSLKNRPGDAETVKNLRLAQKKIKEEEQKEKQKQEQDQQNQDQKKDQNQPKNEQDQNKNEQQQNQNQPQSGDPKQQQPQQQQPQNQQPNQLTKEQARRLLETAIEQEDRKNGKKYRQQRPDPRSKTDKDW